MEGTLVVDAEGKAVAHLIGDRLNVAWLDRYSGEVERWLETRLEGYSGAKLLAVAMLGNDGVRIVMSTAENTYLLRATYPGISKGPPDLELLHKRASRDAVLVGNELITVGPDGCADQSDLNGWLRLQSIDCIDSAGTRSGNLIAAAGRTHNGSLSLVMTTLKERHTTPLPDPPTGVVVVRTVGHPSCVLLHRDGLVISMSYPPSAEEA
jgi:hypothetical protein